MCSAAARGCDGVGGGRSGGVGGGFAAAVVGALPLALMATFGSTDYRRPADVAVVFGARAYADGSPSNALLDRVDAACELYEQGVVPQLVLSGGPGDGAFTEASVMHRMYVERGVPESALLDDDAGLNSRATLRNLKASGLDGGRVLLVSHFYHLPRLKLDAGRLGLDPYTAPAPQRWLLKRMPMFMAREVAAWWRSAVVPLPATLAGRWVPGA